MSVKSSPWILVARRPGGGVEPVTRIKGGRPRYIRSSAGHDLWKWRHRPEGVAAEASGGMLQVVEVLAQRIREPDGEHADPGPALRDEWGLTLLDHLPGPALLIRVPEPSPIQLADIEERIRRVKERERTDVLTDVPGLPRLYVQAVRRGGAVRPLVPTEESIRTTAELAGLDARCNSHLGQPLVLRIVHRFPPDAPPREPDSHLVRYPAAHGLLEVPLPWCGEVALCEEVSP